jgi:hypothetical protein
MTVNSQPNPFEFSEADTCREYETPAIQAAGWVTVHGSPPPPPTPTPTPTPTFIFPRKGRVVEGITTPNHYRVASAVST